VFSLITWMLLLLGGDRGVEEDNLVPSCRVSTKSQTSSRRFQVQLRKSNVPTVDSTSLSQFFIFILVDCQTAIFSLACSPMKV
jgi:hypothetical protein